MQQTAREHFVQDQVSCSGSFSTREGGSGTLSKENYKRGKRRVTGHGPALIQVLRKRGTKHRDRSGAAASSQAKKGQNMIKKKQYILCKRVSERCAGQEPGRAEGRQAAAGFGRFMKKKTHMVYDY